MKRMYLSSVRTSAASLLWGILVLCYSTNAFASADGWASQNGGTTGGEGGITVTVSTASDFKTYVELDSAYIVEVSGAIDLGSVGGGVNIKSNKTIRGIDPNSKIIGRLGFTNDSNNIIIEKLAVTNPSYAEADGISVKNRITNLFIYKCTVYDCGDGCIDISNASDFVTVSWCKFYYTNPGNTHRFVNLFSGSDTATGDRGKLRITFHHNWWSTLCDQRMPRGRFGQVHVYNNYYSCAGNLYCIGVGVEYQLRVESNYFDGINNPWANFNTAGYTPGIIGWNTGNIFYGCTQPTWAVNSFATIFLPPYYYMLGNTADLPTIIPEYAGAETPEPPHWYYNNYGDFDKNSIIDTNDFATFADYWMIYDCNATADADYYRDCIVNFREFNLLAGNWMQ